MTYFNCTTSTIPTGFFPVGTFPTFIQTSTTTSCTMSMTFFIDAGATCTTSIIPTSASSPYWHYWVEDGIGSIPQSLQPVISEEELLARDQEFYRQAMEDCDFQEALRLNRLITERQASETERRLRQEEQARQVAVANEIKQRAADRARGLLLEHLTDDQKKTFEDNGWFVVEGGRSKAKYRIDTRSVAGNIEQLDDQGRTVASICCHIPYAKNVPNSDQHLAQKIMLELAEDDFRRIANISQRRG